jgi:hypothetical protein
MTQATWRPLVPVRKQPGLKASTFSPALLVPVAPTGTNEPYKPGPMALFPPVVRKTELQSCRSSWMLVSFYYELCLKYRDLPYRSVSILQFLVLVCVLVLSRHVFKCLSVPWPCPALYFFAKEAKYLPHFDKKTLGFRAKTKIYCQKHPTDMVANLMHAVVVCRLSIAVHRCHPHHPSAP